MSRALRSQYPLVCRSMATPGKQDTPAAGLLRLSPTVGLCHGAGQPVSGRLQLLREWPPGYGGVERVAHDLADHWHGQGQCSTVFSLGAQPDALCLPDPLPVAYPRRQLPSLVLGRLVLPLPSRGLWRLLWAPDPLHAHLPCPGVLAVALLARLLRPGRAISLHWHSFLEPSPSLAGRLFTAYQALALAVLPLFRCVITTSPLLRQALIDSGAQPERVRVLPCCLPAAAERAADAAAQARLQVPRGGRRLARSHGLGCSWSRQPSRHLSQHPFGCSASAGSTATSASTG